jgi:heat shock protein HslJ
MQDADPAPSHGARRPRTEGRASTRGAGVRRAAIVVLAAVFAGACAAGDAAGPRSDAADQAPSLAELLDGTYEGILGEPVTLSRGIWEGDPLVEGSASRPSVGLVQHFLLEGDFDGDGTPEAAVLLWESSGGSGTRSYLAVMKRVGGEVRNLGTALVGDRTQVMSGSIADGRVILQLVEAGPGEAACCPSQLATAAWVLAEGGLERVATEVTGTLSLAALEGPEWRLVELGRARPVPDDVEITIVFEGDRVAGDGGCNDYFGSVSSKAPGELHFTATGTTMRACPEPAMGLEQQYLAALATASSYRFHGGRLVLGCTTDEGPLVLEFARVAERP